MRLQRSCSARHLLSTENMVSMCVGVWIKRERERMRASERASKRARKSERARERQKESENEREREREGGREREREREKAVRV